MDDTHIELVPRSMMIFHAQSLSGPLKDRIIYTFAGSKVVTLQVPMAQSGEDLSEEIASFAITRGLSIYFWEPSGNRIEVYAGGYTAYPDHPQRVWDSEMLGRGLFYFSGDMIPSFLEIVT